MSASIGIPSRRLRTRRPPRVPRGWPWLVALAALCGAAAGGLWLWQGGWTALAAWTAPAAPALVFEGTRLADAPLLERGEVLLPFSAVKERIDPHAVWDREAQLFILTTDRRLIVFARDDLTAWVNEEPLRLTVPMRVVNDRPYVPARPLAEIYGLDVAYHAATRTVTVDRRSAPRLEGEAEAATWLRTAPGRFAPRLGRVERGSAVRVFEEQAGWYRVRLADGRLGFLPKDAVRLAGLVPGETAAEPSPSAPRSPAGPLHLTWDLVGATPPDVARYPAMPGVNAISPTWLHLAADGSVTSIADAGYVAAAHARGWAVWPLFGNGFDPQLSHRVLHDSRLRLQVERQLLAYARIYGFDGINVDWENMDPADRDAFSQFIRELASLARAAGLVLSVDVTFPGPSPFWQLCYDRAALARAADYVIAMGYDQYTQGSPQAGPVAALPWVEAGVEAMLTEVPAGKLVLGVPLYTRLWTETEDGLTSVALGMADAARYLKRATAVTDAAAGLPYLTWREGAATRKMWLETPATLHARASLARRAGLAGVASWQRAFATGAAWEALAAGLGGEPWPAGELSP
ncbi:MAG: SH3 domain-containing protein [Firmicutes bacterium]|nr:SH3 domain-containing protein [Bacillota bacterium]